VPGIQSPETFIFAAGVGVIGGLVGTAYQLLSKGLQRVLIGPGNLLEASLRLPWYKALLVPFLGACAAAVLDFLLTRRRDTQGMVDVMEAVSMRRAQQLSIRRTLARAMSSLCLIATGGSLGREGPIAYMAASFGARFGRMSRLPRARLGLFAGCGIAAGMSASYYAPFGAALFAMEVVLGNFSVDVLAPVVVSAMVSYLVLSGLATVPFLEDYISGPPLYNLPDFQLDSPAEYLVYFVLGIAAAHAGWLFILSTRGAERFFHWLPIHPRLRLPLGGLILGAIGVFLPHVWGNGYLAVDLVLTGDPPPALGFVAVLFVMKIVATSVTLGSGGSGGIFTPTMFVGAAAGLLIGSLAALLPFVEHPHHYAVVGMGAAIAATTQAPIMAMMLLFEMTLETGLIMPLMLATITASVSAKVMGLDSVYMASLKRRGTAIPEGIEETALTTTLVQDVMRESPTCVNPGTPFDEIAKAVKEMRANSIYVVDKAKTLFGVIRLHDIKSFLQQSGLGELVIAADLMADVPDVHPEHSMAEIVEHFDDPELSDLPVVDPETRKLLGVVDRRDVVSVLSLEILSRGSRRAKFVEHAGAQHYVEMPEGQKMGRIDAPADMFGKSLRDSDLRGRTGLTVLTIVRSTGRIEARPESVVEAGDGLIVMGPVDAIRKLGGDV
jgi:CIC family chloride channel protein